jgi:hypothetical protein
MNQDCCNTGGSFFGSGCNWIIILAVIFIIFSCFCNNKKECIDPYYSNDIF